MKEVASLSQKNRTLGFSINCKHWPKKETKKEEVVTAHTFGHSETNESFVNGGHRKIAQCKSRFKYSSMRIQVIEFLLV